LLRVWNAPWTAATHKSFQPGLQDAVRTFALCTQRLNWPNELVDSVAPFVHRDWWPDDRRQCWSHACQLERANKLMFAKNDSSSVGETMRKMPVTCEPCAGCGFSWYCSKQCKEEDYEAGHKYICGSSLYQGTLTQGTPAEYSLYRSVFKRRVSPALVWNEPAPSQQRKRKASKQMVMDDDEGQEADEEDNNGDDYSASSKTKAICEYFNLKDRSGLRN
jgi:hypothetical protein